MRTFPLFAILFFIVPLIEIYFLVQVGSVIGVFPTIFLVVLTAVLGAFLLKQQGSATLARFQKSVAQGQMPATALLEGMMLLIGGVLLMTPGFFTDAFGFACLLPFSRQWLAKRMLGRVKVQGFGTSAGFSAGVRPGQPGQSHGQFTGSGDTDAAEVRPANTLDGEYTRKD